MHTCFLFTKHIDDNGCYFLKMGPNGELVSPPAYQTFDAIRSLQNESRTLIVETTLSATLLPLELPWLPERKARAAIPYALEDKLAQNFEELHFAFDKTRYQNNQYLVVVLTKERIQFIMQALEKEAIDYEAITLDWFALAPHDVCVSESTLLVNQNDFKGALSGELALAFLKKNPLNQPLLFSDSQIPCESSIPKSKEHSYTWIAQGLINAKPLNLCQGDMQHGNTADKIKKGYQLVGILCCVWLLSLIIVNALSLYNLNKKTTIVDEQIARIYHEFFPDAKQVISPKFRISHLLGNGAQDAQTHFWKVLNLFSKAMKDQQITLEQLRYQNKTLSVTLVSTDFARLEGLENSLKKMNLKVNQVQASTRDNQVVATLEIM